MFSSYKVVNPSLGCRTFAAVPCFENAAYSHAILALSWRCPPRSARAVRPASLAASARYSVCRQSLSQGRRCASRSSHVTRARSLASSKQVCLFRLSLAAFQMQLRVSQRLKPRCSIVQTHSNSKPSTALVKLAHVQPWRLDTEVSASKAKRQVIQQPPNPSFKRTRLRRSA